MSADGASARGTTGRPPPLGTWAEDHDLLLWSKVVNAPDGAGCSLTRLLRHRHDAEPPGVLMHLMVLGAP